MSFSVFSPEEIRTISHVQLVNKQLFTLPPNPREPQHHGALDLKMVKKKFKKFNLRVFLQKKEIVKLVDFS
jgi:hypothetical protein